MPQQKTPWPRTSSRGLHSAGGRRGDQPGEVRPVLLPLTRAAPELQLSLSPRPPAGPAVPHPQKNPTGKSLPGSNFWDCSHRHFTECFAAPLSSLPHGRGFAQTPSHHSPSHSSEQALGCPFPKLSAPYQSSKSPETPWPHSTDVAGPRRWEYCLRFLSISRKHQTNAGNNPLVPQPPHVHPAINSSCCFYCHFISRDTEVQGLHLFFEST